MNEASKALRPCGIVLALASPLDERSVSAFLQEHELSDQVDLRREAPAQQASIRITLKPHLAQAWAPDYNTLSLCKTLGLDTQARSSDLDREILITLLLSPVTFSYPSLAELQSAIRIRRYIAEGGRLTSLAFDTDTAERPEGYFSYAEDCGFRLAQGKHLIDALTKATQPEVSGNFYAFSCYRATEYVMLLALARELQTCNPPLLEALETQWRRRAIMSGEFHEVFLKEYGSMEAPLPPGYYVPGDRLWFRNPDDRSSDVKGFEGSWVLYLGDGLFTNFWKHSEPYTMADKCLEIYHWRDGVHVSAVGKLMMNEPLVEARVEESLSQPEVANAIITRMMRLRDPKGVYAEGGCIDTSRECLRWVCPGSSDIRLPAA